MSRHIHRQIDHTIPGRAYQALHARKPTLASRFLSRLAIASDGGLHDPQLDSSWLHRRDEWLKENLRLSVEERGSFVDLYTQIDPPPQRRSSAYKLQIR